MLRRPRQTRRWSYGGRSGRGGRAVAVVVIAALGLRRPQQSRCSCRGGRGGRSGRVMVVVAVAALTILRRSRRSRRSWRSCYGGRSRLQSARGMSGRPSGPWLRKFHTLLERRVHWSVRDAGLRRSCTRVPAPAMRTLGHSGSVARATMAPAKEGFEARASGHSCTEAIVGQGAARGRAGEEKKTTVARPQQHNPARWRGPRWRRRRKR